MAFFWRRPLPTPSPANPEHPLGTRRDAKQRSGCHTQHVKPTKRAFRHLFAPSGLHGRVYKPARRGGGPAAAAQAPNAPVPAGPENARTRLLRPERARRLRPGSMFPVLTSLT